MCPHIYTHICTYVSTQMQTSPLGLAAAVLTLAYLRMYIYAQNQTYKASLPASAALLLTLAYASTKIAKKMLSCLGIHVRSYGKSEL